MSVGRASGDGGVVVGGEGKPPVVVGVGGNNGSVSVPWLCRKVLSSVVVSQCSVVLVLCDNILSSYQVGDLINHILSFSIISHMVFANFPLQYVFL